MSRRLTQSLSFVVAVTPISENVWGPFPGGLAAVEIFGGGVAEGLSGLGALGGGRMGSVAALSGLEGGSCKDTPGLPSETGLLEGLAVRLYGMVCG